MADLVDRAQQLEEAEREGALARAQARAPAELPWMILGKPYCRECGDKLAPERLQAVPDACRCVECQTWLDKHSTRAR